MSDPNSTRTTTAAAAAVLDAPAAGTAMTPMPVAVSAVIFALRDGSLELPLVWRTKEPHARRWALPGGPVLLDEGLGDAAGRTLAETTGLRPAYLEQLYTFGLPGRSPSGRVVTVAYWALVRSDEAEQAEQAFATEGVRWFPADDLPRLAFDHNAVVEYALWRLRNKVEYAHVAYRVLGDTFTMAQLRGVYEAILGRQLDPANFRRHVEATGTIVPTAHRLTGGRHRPPRLYTCHATIGGLARGPAS